MAESKVSGKVLAALLRNKRGAKSKDMGQRLHDLRPLTPSAEYVAAANQMQGRQTPPMAGESLGGGYDISQAQAQPEAMLEAPAQPSAEYVARVAQAMGRPGMGPQTVASMAELEQAARASPLSRRAAAPAFAGARASGNSDPRMLALALRGGR